MHFLPGLQHGGFHLRLPLVPETAAGLASALLAPAVQRLKLVEGLLLRDVILAIWTCLLARHSSGQSLSSPPSAAAWLSENCLFALRWGEQDSATAGLAVEKVKPRSMADSVAPVNSQHSSGFGLPNWIADHFGQSLVDASIDPPSTNGSLGRPTTGVDESSHSAGVDLSRLVNQLGRLADLEESFDRALEHAKLDAMKEFAYGAGHEINNPLANISARAQTLLKEEDNPERRRKLAAINTQAFRAHEMIADMMLFARPPKLALAPVDLQVIIDKVIADMTPQAEAAGIEFVRDTDLGPIEVEADSAQLKLALRSLFSNAIEALGSGGRITISQQLSQSPSSLQGGPQDIQIVVADNGPGITPEVRAHLFDPFYSGREAGRGLGFGLAKCWRIVTAHGGRIDVESQLGEGACFTITLPRRSSESLA